MFIAIKCYFKLDMSASLALRKIKSGWIEYKYRTKTTICIGINRATYYNRTLVLNYLDSIFKARIWIEISSIKIYLFSNIVSIFILCTT